ncbi:hypothetical protein [Pantoea dispersa]|uniref:hypothetical protein n=1 Tax=Pantoea dispersa TaxID=59814 RepID=UPI0024AF00C7|nr:hypothetical protein [Pantoea dispersa]MDI6637077.1 hypothetical protein [Pantoea dispersa]
MSNEISNERLEILAAQVTMREQAQMAKELLALRRTQKEWTNEQCLEFLSIAFRHAKISGDIEMDDIRLGIRMVNAAAPEVK